MELNAATSEVYLRNGFSQIELVVESLTDEELNRVVNGEGTNSISGLVVHTCAAVEFWLGHVALGAKTDRTRETEFGTVASQQRLLELIKSAVISACSHLSDLESGTLSPEDETPEHAENRALIREFMPGGDKSDAALVLHVFEELYQHLGHIEATRDAIVAERDS